MKEKFYFDFKNQNLIKDNGIWFFVYKNGEWIRSKYYEGILIGNCWCDPISFEEAKNIIKELNNN